MGIDRIAGHPAGVPAQDTSGTSGAGAPRATFEVSRPDPAQPSERVALASAAVDPARPNSVDVAAYIDRKVNEATSHLSALPAAELEAIRGALRDRMANDPSLVDLVRTITGQPSVQSDE